MHAHPVHSTYYVIVMLDKTACVGSIITICDRTCQNESLVGEFHYELRNENGPVLLEQFSPSKYSSTSLYLVSIERRIAIIART